MKLNFLVFIGMFIYLIIMVPANLVTDEFEDAIGCGQGNKSHRAARAVDHSTFVFPQGVDCCRDLPCTDYRGNLARTASGRTCIQWSSSPDSEHLPENKPNAGLEGNNYCRNPSNNGGGPWCYTGDHWVWDYCDVTRCADFSVARGPYCNGVINLAQGGTASASSQYSSASSASMGFAGTRKEWHSADGMPQWLMYELAVPTKICKITFFPRRDNSGGNSPRDCPWSYTFQGSNDGSDFDILLTVENQGPCTPRVKITKSFINDRAFKFYRIEVTRVPGRTYGRHYAVIRDLRFFGVETTCCLKRTCGDYHGFVRKTKKGKPCKPWEGSRHSDLDANFCRNPMHTNGGAWCYTGDSERWDYCPVDVCNATCCWNTKHDDKCSRYRGVLATTVTGNTCVDWNAHSHHFTRDKFPNDGLDYNYCRNPNPSDERKAWCYITKTGSPSWEYCDVCDTDGIGLTATPNDKTLIDKKSEVKWLWHPKMCPPHWFVRGFYIQREVLHPDSAGLILVQFKCQPKLDGGPAIGWPDLSQSKEIEIGFNRSGKDWIYTSPSLRSCPNIHHWVVGIQVIFQHHSKGAVGLRALCNMPMHSTDPDDSYLFKNDVKRGHWAIGPVPHPTKLNSDSVVCPSGKAVCGANARMDTTHPDEIFHGSGINEVTIICCFIFPPSPAKSNMASTE